MIIPIGHDKGVRRLPYVTAAIIVICTLLQLHRSLYAPSWEELATKSEERLALVDEVVRDLHRRGAPFELKAIAAATTAASTIRCRAAGVVTGAGRAVPAGLALRFGWAPDRALSPT